MKYTQKHYLVFSLVLFCLNVHAQDKIYYKKKKTDDWKITEIKPGAIKGVEVANPQVSNSTTDANVLFVFNNMGNFLVIPGLYDNPIKAEVYIKNFFNQADPNFGKMDKIITVKNDIITGTIQLEKENAIEYIVGNKFISIPKKDVALVIFRDGKHKMIASADKTFKTLKSMQDTYYERAFSAKKKEDTAFMKDTQVVATSAPAKDTKKDTIYQPVVQQSAAGKILPFQKRCQTPIIPPKNQRLFPPPGATPGRVPVRRPGLIRLPS